MSCLTFAFWRQSKRTRALADDLPGLAG